MAATGKTPILLYGSTTPTNTPTAGNLTNSSDGCEIAINVADKNLFFKDSTNAVNIVPIRQSSASSNGWLSSTDWNTFNGKAPAFTYTSGYIPFGQGTTTPNQSVNLFWDNSNTRLGINNSSPAKTLDVGGVIQSNRSLGGGSFDGIYSYTNNGNVYTYSDGSYLATYTNNTERIRVFNSGGISIGNTTDPGAANLSVSGNGLFGTTTNTYRSAVTAKSNGDNVAGQFYRQGTGVGTAIVLFSSNATATESLRSYIDTSTGALTVLSDESLKENLVPITDAINKVKSLRSYIGNYIGDESKHPFLIAQDVQKALPEAVSKSPTGKLGLSYSEVIPLLVAAFNEQQMLIEALQKKLGE